MLNLAGTVDIPKIPELQEIVIDKEFLKALKKHKLITMECYVFLVIKIFYGNKSSVGVCMEQFKKIWGVNDDEIHLAIAKLQKKKILTTEPVKFVQLELFDLESEDDF